MNTALTSVRDVAQGDQVHLLDAFWQHTRDHPHRPAIISTGQTVDYLTLSQRIADCALALADLGVKRYDLVAFDAVRSPRALILVLALLHRGAAYLPLDPRLPAARRAHILEDAKPQWLLAQAQAIAADRSALNPTNLPLRLAALDELYSTDSKQIRSHPRIDDIAISLHGELAYVLFTSGSTGRPKGVAMGAAALTHLIAWHTEHARLGNAARTLQFAPLSFDVSFQEILSTLATGGSLVLPTDAQRRDPWALIDLIERARIERIFLPYVALQSLAEAAVPDHVHRLAGLRDVITAGEQLRITPALRRLFAELHDCVLHNHYGPTEAHVVSAYELSGDPARWAELPSIGRALPHAKLEVVDAQLRPVSAGHEGELLIGGACLAQGYIHRPELTATSFIERDGTRFYRTGDRVRATARGEVSYLGRLDDQIKLAGFRVEPGEIESVLHRHPGVAEAVVVVERVSSEPRLVAHIVPRDLHSNESELAVELRRHCANLLADYLVPQGYFLHQILPMTASGKIDRQALALNRNDDAIPWDTALPLQAQLINLWCRLLDLDNLDATANLFDHGARSLTVVHALTELRRHGHVMSVAQAYEHPSAAAQARLLAAPNAPITDQTSQQRAGRQREALAGFARRRGT